MASGEDILITSTPDKVTVDLSGDSVGIDVVVNGGMVLTISAEEVV